MPNSRRTGTRKPVTRSAPAPAAPSAPSRPASTAARPVTSAAAAPQQARNATPAAAPQAQTPMAAPTSSGGGIGGFVSNMAAATAGSVIGHTIAHGVLGLGHSAAGSRNEHGDEVPAESAASGEAAAQSSGLNMQPVERTNPCYAQQLSFQKCLENNDSDLSRCQWASDLFKECRIQNQRKEQSIRL